MRLAAATVAIVIPAYKLFNKLNKEELISLARTFEVLKGYTIYFVCPDDLDVNGYTSLVVSEGRVNFLRFGRSYFKNIAGYNQLLLSAGFYAAFDRYQYILICQPDVFVFADELAHFIGLGYDYIGAPFFANFSSTVENSETIGVGNGGFSLRKVSAALSILAYFDSLKNTKVKDIAKQPKAFLKIVKHELLRLKRGYPSILPWKYDANEDLFWSLHMSKFFSWYKVSNVEDAIAFAFETRPELLFELNKNKLPMGVHAWEKYNPEFWKPFIEQFGYTL